jgi:farnesyl diphosphate synthase
MVGILGVDGAKARLQQLVADAERALAPFGAASAILIDAAHFVAERRA